MLGAVVSIKVFCIVYISYMESLLAEHDNKIINVSITVYIILYKSSGAAVVIVGINLKYHSLHLITPFLVNTDKRVQVIDVTMCTQQLNISFISTKPDAVTVAIIYSALR